MTTKIILISLLFGIYGWNSARILVPDAPANATVVAPVNR